MAEHNGVFRLNILYILLVILLFFVGCQSKNSNFSESIIKTLDTNCNNSNECKISMQEITDFKWDKMAVFGIGSSNSEISKALGVRFESSTDLMSGIVFVLGNKIVYEERVPYNPERAAKLEYIVEHKAGGTNCVIYTPDNAILKGSKNKSDRSYYYKVIASVK